MKKYFLNSTKSKMLLKQLILDMGLSNKYEFEIFKQEEPDLIYLHLTMDGQSSARCIGESAYKYLEWEIVSSLKRSIHLLLRPHILSDFAKKEHLTDVGVNVITYLRDGVY